MTTETLKSAKKNLDSADVVRDCGHGRLEIVNLCDTIVTRITLQPGWRWSEHVRPMAHTDRCQVQHMQYAISGRMMIEMDDGSQIEVSAGDFAVIAPGHDAWVVGNEPFVGIDFSPDMKAYAQDESQRPHMECD